MYSMPLIAGPRFVRPLAPADVEGTIIWGDAYYDDPVVAAALAREGYMMENSVYTAGLYLTAQVERHRATGSPQALHEARRAFEALWKIYEMNVAAGRAGFFSKPYGSRATIWSSPDQHLAALAGLYAYHSLADAGTKQRIARLFVDAADFAKSRDYQLCLGDLGGWKMKDELHAYTAVFMLMQALAWHVSREPRFRDELMVLDARSRWKTETELERWRTWPEWVLITEQCIIAHFAIVAGEILQEITPEIFARNPWPGVLRDWWRFSLTGMDANFLFHYWKEINTRTGAWRPTGLRVPPDLHRTAQNLFTKYQSDVCHGEVGYRVGYNSLVAALGCPEVAGEASRWLREILDRTDGNRLRWMIDPDGQQLLPPLRWMACLLSSESPYLYLITYWRGRRNGLWD
jgi:hypothetical protein